MLTRTDISNHMTGPVGLNIAIHPGCRCFSEPGLWNSILFFIAPVFHSYRDTNVQARKNCQRPVETAVLYILSCFLVGKWKDFVNWKNVALVSVWYLSTLPHTCSGSKCRNTRITCCKGCLRRGLGVQVSCLFSCSCVTFLLNA